MASKSVTIKLKGFAELADSLKDFGPRTTRNGLRSSTFAGARVIRDEARLNVQRPPLHVRTGTLLEAIAAFRRRTPDYQAKYAIGLRRLTKKFSNTRLNRRLRKVNKKYRVDSPAFYGKFLERGSSRMSTPHPWLRPAFDHRVDAAIEAIRGGLAKAVAKAVRDAKKAAA